MKNIKTEIISKSDYEMLCIMAKKYNMSVEDFGKLISKKMGKENICQSRFSADELQIVDYRAGRLNISRSEYCRRCYIKAISEKLYKKMDIRELKKDGTVRDLRVSISFDDAEQYKEMRRIAKELSVPFATLIRRFALTVEL